MFEWLINLFKWLANLWEQVPNPVKEKIISTIVETFETIFREYYRSKKQEKENISE